MKSFNSILSLIILSMSFHASAIKLENITMMSYNIKGHSITDTRLDNIAKVINYNMPDIVAVQEVDNRSVIGLKKDNLGYLATATGMFSNFYPLVGTYYGIGLLSKTKPLSIENRTYTRGENSTDKEDRGIIIAEFEYYYFISTHYSLNADDRDTATADIIKFAKSADKPVFVAGDFNAAPTYRAMVTFKNNGFKILNDISQYTFPSNEPTQCIDMIIYYDSTQQFNFNVTESGVALSGGVDITNSDVTSDHLPVFVTLDNVTASTESITLDKVSIIANTNSFSISGLSNEISQVDIFNITGMKVKSFNISNGETFSYANPIDKGIYIINIKNRTENRNFKLMFN